MAQSDLPSAAASTICLRKATCRGVPMADVHCRSCRSSASSNNKAGVDAGASPSKAESIPVVQLFAGHHPSRTAVRRALKSGAGPRGNSAPAGCCAHPLREAPCCRGQRAGMRSSRAWKRGWGRSGSRLLSRSSQAFCIRPSPAAFSRQSRASAVRPSIA
jgi:hypothetical protein